MLTVTPPVSEMCSSHTQQHVLSAMNHHPTGALASNRARSWQTACNKHSPPPPGCVLALRRKWIQHHRAMWSHFLFTFQYSDVTLKQNTRLEPQRCLFVLTCVCWTGSPPSHWSRLRGWSLLGFPRASPRSMTHKHTHISRTYMLNYEGGGVCLLCLKCKHHSDSSELNTFFTNNGVFRRSMSSHKCSCIQVVISRW